MVKCCIIVEMFDTAFGIACGKESVNANIVRSIANGTI